MSTLKEMTDEELALLYAKGNNKAFDELLPRVQDKIFSYIIYMVKEEDLANDVFQETFTKAIAKLRGGQYSNSGKFLYWLTRIAHNAVMDCYRSLKSKHIVDSNKENNIENLHCASVLDTCRESEIVKEQSLHDVRRMMDALPQTQRDVVFMKYYQGLSFKEIAEETGVSINTSLGRMRYALINLRKLSRINNISLTLE
ncbi:MAG: sigma-70 family RNA polymerase sigma factor [Prevotella sp.]|nr:sigma-70 family RNA polymerase sigma factor [Prevotella sp.]